MDIEWIKHGNQVLGIIISSEYHPLTTEFITPDSFTQQVGFIVYSKSENIVPHIHRDIDRKIQGTSEVLLVRKGCCWVDFYLNDKSPLCSKKLTKGDVLILVSGGHGFRMVKDTTFLEIKQGPYIGEHDKDRFQN